MDPHSEALLSQVFPPLSIRVHTQYDLLSNEGIEIRVTQAGRTYAEQDAIYAKGRTTRSEIPCTHNRISRPIGSCTIHPFGATVTNAKGGYSWHNFFLAVDEVPDDPSRGGFQPDWNDAHPIWARLIDIGTICGLHNGKSWRDEPHFQLTGQYPVTPTDEVRALYQDGGVKAVWQTMSLTS